MKRRMNQRMHQSGWYAHATLEANNLFWSFSPGPSFKKISSSYRLRPQAGVGAHWSKQEPPVLHEQLRRNGEARKHTNGRQQTPAEVCL